MRCLTVLLLLLGGPLSGGDGEPEFMVDENRTLGLCLPQALLEDVAQYMMDFKK